MDFLYIGSDDIKVMMDTIGFSVRDYVKFYKFSSDFINVNEVK